MGRLLGGLGSLVAYLSVATAIAAVSGLAYLRSAGRLNDETLARLWAVVQGIELPPAAGADGQNTQTKQPEQPSYDERVRATALQARQLEMREQSVRNLMTEVQRQLASLEEQNKRYDLIKDGFRKELAEVRAGVQSSGRTNVMQTLVSIKPKQAKEQLMQMVKSQELDEVVTILSLMPLDNRAKIVSEFKSAEEVKLLDDILRLIRQSRAENELVDRTEQSIGSPQ